MKKLLTQLNSYIYNLQCNFCEWLQRRLYDELTWAELDNKCMKLENKIEELESELAEYKELEEYRNYRRYA